jgi:hypothetical protein
MSFLLSEDKGKRMANITSLNRPEVFANAPALPTGFHYILQSVGVYTFGQFTNLYQIGVVKEDDFSVIYGDQFYPSDSYPDAQSMIDAEALESYNNWNKYYLADGIATSAHTLIGF